MNLLTRQEAADILRVAVSTLDRVLSTPDSGGLKIVKVGRRVLIDQASIESFVKGVAS